MAQTPLPDEHSYLLMQDQGHFWKELNDEVQVHSSRLGIPAFPVFEVTRGHWVPPPGVCHVPIWVQSGSARDFGLAKCTPNTYRACTSIDLAVMRSDPFPHFATDVPGSVVPDQDPHPLAQRLQSGTAPLHKLNTKRTNRVTFAEPQPGLLLPLSRRIVICACPDLTCNNI
jgi:hypothetical protein